MKKLILIIAIVLVFGGFILLQGRQGETNSSPSPIVSSSPGTGIYKDGSYTGKVGSASIYGNVKVKAVIQNGKLTDIEYLEFPNSPGHTTEVSNMALPILKQEAITKQSAKVDNVSGATQTTEGFIETLQSALDQAKV